MDLPLRVTQSRLWKRIEEREEYVHALAEMRKLAEALGNQIQHTIPEYTDHSISHMDALWGVADQILSDSETNQVNAAEAFVLGACFYVHDLGMALAATPDGLAQVRRCDQYRAALQKIEGTTTNISTAQADVLAIRIATRELHAGKAAELISGQLPGLDRYLVEDSNLRQRWAHMIGQIAASHHWNLDRVHRDLGMRNAVPSADGYLLDLGYLACILRIVDYAHINRERALGLDRKLRSDIPIGSSVHWDAQANITGPFRQDNSLVYGCTEPLEQVDAWWLFYDLASGLDAEIGDVREYLRGRVISATRFSLQGVKGIERPQTFINFVQLAGDTAPIDIRVQPHSMERVVELLGGPQLYGWDSLAPIRELIQNARDAIVLRNAAEAADAKQITPGQIVICLDDERGEPVLTVSDNGVGMTRSVVVHHLIAVGSDFWHSADFYRDFGKALDQGFRPIGKFGIGFLSVFMLGDRIEVNTQAAGSSKLQLRLRGLGRRGELHETIATSTLGTEVRIFLKPEIVGLLADLAGVVRARAPMLNIPVTVRRRSGSSMISERIETGWWKHVDITELEQFVHNWNGVAHNGKSVSPVERPIYFVDGYSSGDFGGKFSVRGWPGLRPQFVDEQTRLISAGGQRSFGVIRCSQGIAVEVDSIDDVTGIAECGELPLTASRESTFGRRSGHHRPHDRDLAVRARSALEADIVAKLNELERYGMIPARLRFLRGLVGAYGKAVLIATNLRWIPVVEPPGNLIHHSRRELIDRLKELRSVVLSCGASAGTTYASAAPLIPHDELGRRLMITIPIEEVEVRYDDKNALKHNGETSPISGTLTAILGKLTNSVVNLVLTLLLLDFIAEAWGKAGTTLRDRKWYLDYESNVLWADLSKDD